MTMNVKMVAMIVPLMQHVKTSQDHLNVLAN